MWRKLETGMREPFSSLCYNLRQSMGWTAMLVFVVVTSLILHCVQGLQGVQGVQGVNCVHGVQGVQGVQGVNCV